MHAAAVLKASGAEKNLLGVFGGDDGAGFLSSCEVYDVIRDR
ncbi:unnamed protein product [Dibothriocephalus latus]|uniref:Uncharacterized protein n=1 Tax=Dibothriocephalus latus TaxID=60516 RepID=A0A3P7NN16_DIBLA|nr:unnamed protein product [Dibothriocephalus latus]